METMGTKLESRIRERAYFIWEDQGRPAGLELAHWLEAEQELRRRKARGSSAPADEPVPKKRTRSASPKGAKAKSAKAKSAKPRASSSPGKPRSRPAPRDH